MFSVIHVDGVFSKLARYMFAKVITKTS